MNGIQRYPGPGSGEQRPITILIADDDRTNTAVLESMVRKEGFAAVVAADGAQAVALFQQHRPDLVLMDVMMPMLDGYEATRRIKALAGELFVPMIFLTALNDEESLAACVTCGGDDFLTKPYKRLILKAKIDAMLRVRELYATLQTRSRQVQQHRDRLQREHEIAERVFTRILSPSSLDVDHIRYLLSPLDTTNGDLLLVGRRSRGCYHYLLGDFTGHGLSAAIGAIPVSDIFVTMTRKGLHAAEIVAEINRKLKAVLPTGLFFAAAMVELDVNSATLTVWNGGVPDLLVVNRQGIRARVSSKHLPLGVLGHELFDPTMETVCLQPGDRIYAYSDGVVEATNPAGEMFGQARFEALFASLPAAGHFEAIRHSVERFQEGVGQQDDITLLEIDVERAFAEDRDSEVDPSQPVHWRMALDLCASMLKRSDPLPVLVQMLGFIQGLETHKEHLFTILAELYNNALDHGVLRLDGARKNSPDGFAAYYRERDAVLARLTEGWVKVEIRHRVSAEAGQVVVIIEDSGPGFDSSTLPPQLAENDSYSGRGIHLVRSLCAEVNFYGRGNRVEAIYRW